MTRLVRSPIGKHLRCDQIAIGGEPATYQVPEPAAQMRDEATREWQASAIALTARVALLVSVIRYSRGARFYRYALFLPVTSHSASAFQIAHHAPRRHSP